MAGDQVNQADIDEILNTPSKPPTPPTKNDGSKPATPMTNIGLYDISPQNDLLPGNIMHLKGAKLRIYMRSLW